MYREALVLNLLNNQHERNFVKRKEAEMLDMEIKYKQCTICRHEYTSIHTELTPGINIYVCNDCLDAARYNFIWVCMRCGKVYLRSKKLVIDRLKNTEIRRAYILCEDMKIIQGLDTCIACDSGGIINYMDALKIASC
jgi:hypothetical protein